MPDSRHVTLTADVVTSVTLDQDYNNVEVVNVDGAAAVYFTLDGSEPDVESDGTVVLPAAIGRISVQPETGDLTTVKLISSGTPKVAVRGW